MQLYKREAKELKKRRKNRRIKNAIRIWNKLIKKSVNVHTKPIVGDGRNKARRRKERKRDILNKGIYNEIIEEINRRPNKTIAQKNKIIRDKLVFQILWATGMRINELGNLTYQNWQELCTTGKTMIYESKNKKSKEVLITEQTKKDWQKQEWAEKWFMRYPEAPVLRTGRGRKLAGRYVVRYYNKILKPIGEKYGLKLRTHSFRISLITKLLEQTDSVVVKDIIGHSDIKTTLRYNRGSTTEKRKREALEQRERIE